MVNLYQCVLLFLFIIHSFANDRPCGKQSSACGPTNVVTCSNNTCYPDLSVNYVDAVFMTHLDWGFSNYTSIVCENYFFSLFPQIFNIIDGTANDLMPFVYTSHPWLIQEFLYGTSNCTTKRPSRDLLDRMTKHIVDGKIRWHGQALSLFTELASPLHFDWSLTISKDLNKKLNVSYGVSTAELTDVVGFSKSVIPHFSKAGIQLLQVGYNQDCRGPCFPPTPPPMGNGKSNNTLGSCTNNTDLICTTGVPGAIFNWLHKETNTSVVAIYSKGYGGGCGPQCPPGDCTFYYIKSNNRALLYFYADDNQISGGSYWNFSTDSVRKWYNGLKKVFPNAQIKATSLEEWATKSVLLPNIKSSLPVLTKEIGDTWLYGAPSDSWRIAAYREHMLSLDEFFSERSDIQKEKLLKLMDTYLSRLLKIPEHNWGLGINNVDNAMNIFWNAPDNWSNLKLYKIFPEPATQALLKGWIEQRDYLLNHGLDKYFQFNNDLKHFATLIDDRLQKLIPNTNKMYLGQITDKRIFQCKDFKIGFDNNTGAVNELIFQGRNWASDNKKLGWLRYKLFSNVDVMNFALDTCASVAFSKGPLYCSDAFCHVENKTRLFLGTNGTLTITECTVGNYEPQLKDLHIDIWYSF